MIMPWEEEADWLFPFPGCPDAIYNSPSQSSPDVQQPSSNDNLDDVSGFNHELAWREKLEFKEEEEPTPFIGGQSGAQQKPVPCQRQTAFKKEEKAAYVKKPLNAFMLFIKRNRAAAEAELGVRRSAVVNKHLGQQWKSLSPEVKGSYVAEAKEEAALHSIQNPNWTNKVNYGSKKKRR